MQPDRQRRAPAGGPASEPGITWLTQTKLCDFSLCGVAVHDKPWFLGMVSYA